MNTNTAPSLYLLRDPTAAPGTPERWTWSTLQEWRRCPRQWWLRRARYQNASTPYPQQMHAATVEGILLHYVIDTFVAHVGRQGAIGVTNEQAIRESFPARSVVQQKLREILRDETNPRTDVARVLARVSVDKCVNAFRAAAKSCMERADVGRKGPPATPQHPKQLRFGTEVPIQVAEPALGGRLDYFTPKGIVDFKTGSPDITHHEQLRFYAMMVWRITGRAPNSLTILYVHEKRHESVPVPAHEELSQMAQSCKSEIASISEEIAAGIPPAKPSDSNCVRCPVRQLCDTYWTAPETAALRLTPAHVQKLDNSARAWMDVECMALSAASRGGGVVGTGFVPGVGEVDVSIGSSHDHRIERAPSARVRMLNAFVELRNGIPSIGVNTASEVFWMAP